MAEQGAAIASLINEMCEMATSTTDANDVSLSPATSTREVVECTISLVEGRAHAVEPGEYTPGKVRIGPYYYGYRSSAQYLWMEKEKKALLHGLLPAVKQERQDTLERYLTAMVAEGVEGDARQYYNSTFSKMSKGEFACMLLLDGCYLLSRFVPTTGSTLPAEDITVVRDVVFLLENQIPFFVLEKIHKLITGGALDDESIVLRSVAHHVEQLVRRNRYSLNTLELDPAPRLRPCHLLHLLYMYFRPKARDGNSHASIKGNVNGAHGRSNSGAREADMRRPTTVALSRWDAATNYHVAGVRLVKRNLDGTRARSVLDVELTGGTLHIPCLMVDSSTLTILRNMVALEQKSPQLGSHVTAYCLFMSQMASTKKDVALLVEKGIVVHYLGSHEDLAAEFVKLCNGVVLDLNDPGFNYLRPVQEALQRLSWPRWRKAMAWLRHTKCNNPLMVLGLLAAIIIFVCTPLQVVFAGLSYAQGNKKLAT